MLRVIIASDSFKGSLTSAEVARGIEYGLRSVFPDCECIKLSIADGGEGTVDALIEALGGSRVNCRVHDPLMREMTVSYSVLGDGLTAVIDAASASGLALLSNEERNPLKTSTFGTGEMILDALERGCRHFLVGLGGSATNDGGIGLFSALGYRFLDNAGRILPGCGESLVNVADIDASGVHPGLETASFTVACDVDAPFCGPDGAACVFSPQKGAGPEDVAMLDRGLANFANVVHQCLGRDISKVPGAGAAGGLGGGFLAFSNAVLKSGIDMVLDALDFDSVIGGADLVITGEGRIDSQTFRGKAPYGVMLRARARNIPVYAIGGCASLEDVNGIAPLSGVMEGAFTGLGFDCIVPCVAGEYDVDYVLRPDVAIRNVYAAAVRLGTLLA
ncbi:MAG: glycerate kinase [Candidatus Cryptobacteroides sp.]